MSDKKGGSAFKTVANFGIGGFAGCCATCCVSIS